MHGRTVILVSHHVQLCAPGASYVVALENGRVAFQGDRDSFLSSGVLNTLVQSGATDANDELEETAVADVEDLIAEKELSDDGGGPSSETTSTAAASETETKPEKPKAPRKLVEEETRAVGHISRGHLDGVYQCVWWSILLGSILHSSSARRSESCGRKWMAAVRHKAAYMIPSLIELLYIAFGQDLRSRLKNRNPRRSTSRSMLLYVPSIRSFVII